MNEIVHAAVRENVWAVVGASNDRSKFGNRIYRDLRAAGYTVYPVNPGEHEIEGDVAYPRLQDLPETPAVVDVVVPSRIGIGILTDAVESGARYFWLQPGAESDELISLAEAADIELIHDRCAMVEKIQWARKGRSD